MKTKRPAPPPASGRILWLTAEPEAGADLRVALAAAGWSVSLLAPAGGGPKPTRREMLDVRFAGRRVWCELEVTEGAAGESWRVAMPEELARESAPALRRAGLLALVGRELLRRASPPFAALHAQGAEAALAVALLAANEEKIGARSLFAGWPLVEVSVPTAEAAELGLPSALADPRLGNEPDEVDLFAVGLACADGVLLAAAPPSVEPGTALAAGLAARADAIVLPPGLLPERFDPATDSHLAASFAAGRPGGKAKCKAALQAELGLAPRPKTPLVGFLGPLAPAAGADRVLLAAPALLRAWAQLVLLDPEAGPLEETARGLAARHAGRVACVLDAEAALVRRTAAACDLVLVPADGAQAAHDALLALRYGALPVALAAGAPAPLRAVGARGGDGQANAFLFRTATAAALERALVKALDAFRDRPRWRTLRDAALATDVSLEPAVAAYGELVRTLAVRPRRGIVPPPPPERRGLDIAPVVAEPIARPVATPAEAPSEPAAAEPFIDWGPPPPERYGENVLTLLVQGPRTLYAFWELAAPAARSVPAAGLELHLLSDGDSRRLAEGLGDFGDYWIHGHPGREYRVELRAPAGEVLLRSAEVETPREAAPLGGDVRWVRRDRRRAGLVSPLPSPASTAARRRGSRATPSVPGEPPSPVDSPAAPAGPASLLARPGSPSSFGGSSEHRPRRGRRDR